MAEKRRKKKFQDEPEKPSKEEYAVAKHLRFNVPNREGKLVSMPVQCFFASKAVDCLMDSKWATNKGKTVALFTTRGSCVDYCNRLLSKGIFHRAFRQEKSKDKKKSKDKTEEKSKEKKTKKKEDEKLTSKDEKKGDDSSKESDKKPEKKDEEKKKKREKKLKLEMHESQKFIDGDEVYVWIYDPVPLKNKLIGLLLVLGAIGVCLFPLWPPEVRLGVYYLSLAAAGFIGLILVLTIVRLILFGLVWGLSFGTHHLWIFPNLTEDVGILESFMPLYHHERAAKEEKKTESDAESDSNINNGSEVNSKSTASGEKTLEAGEPGVASPEPELVADDDSEEAASHSNRNSQEENDYEILEAEEIDSAKM